MKSSLTNKTILAHSSNYTKGRKDVRTGISYKICKITPHIMAGVLTGEQCAKNIFQKPNRNASANYCIGVKGDIVCNVEEENRAWTSSNRVNDFQAITIEVSNSKMYGNWPISDASWKSLVNLCADICKRYNFKLVYDGTPKGSLTRHNMFANTSCPGKYLQSKFPQLVKEVNARLVGDNSKPSQNTFKSYKVKINTAVLNVRAGAGTNYKINTTVKRNYIYTIVDEKNGWGKLKSGAGWIKLSYTKRV